VTPETFHDLLDDATRTPPPAPPAGRDLAAGRRRLRRRRLLTGAAALAVVAAAAGGTALATRPGPAPTPVAVDPGRDADVLAQCRAGKQREGDPGAAVFDGADPVVEAVADEPFAALLEAPGGRYWAICQGGRARAQVVAYDADAAQRAPRPTDVIGPGCALAAGDDGTTCPSARVRVATRLPAEVAAVRVTTQDGDTYDTPSVDGYVLVDHVFTLPAGETYGAWTTPRPGGPATPVVLTYLDATGTPIAGAPGLPDLSAYPVLGGVQRWV
jgi:hypothetical protein